MNELRDHLDIKDRKISVLQRKVGAKIQFCCKFNNFCKFENPRLRIWRIFWKRRIIRLTLPSLDYNRWHFRKYFDCETKTKTELLANYSKPIFSVWKLPLLSRLIIFARYRPSPTPARALSLAWRRLWTTETSRSTSWGSRGTGQRRTPKRRRNCTRESWPSTKWKFTLTIQRWRSNSDGSCRLT